MVDSTRLIDLGPFAGLETEQLELAGSNADELTVAPGTTVCSEDDFGYSLYVVEEGTADVVQDGRELRSLGRGDVFGELGLLVTGRRTASVVARSELRVLAFFDPDYRRLEREIPELARNVRTQMAQRTLRPSADAARG
jgi:CRP-like cAMP-binding protein